MDAEDQRSQGADVPTGGPRFDVRRRSGRSRDVDGATRSGHRPEPTGGRGTGDPAAQPDSVVRKASHRSGEQAGERSPGGEQRDDRKRRRDGHDGSSRRPFAGFGDGDERAYCAAARKLIPETFPVLHRQGVATRRVVVVDSRPGAILLCDGAHEGLHRWPEGDEVDHEPATSPNAPGIDATDMTEIEEVDRDRHPDEHIDR